MANIVVVGAQWGDEGKGKLVDLLTERADVVVRFQGGNNAGHTLVVGDKKTVLHLVPSGALHERKTLVIGAGVVVDPLVLITEIQQLRSAGHLSTTRLVIDGRAQLILSPHLALERAMKATNDEIGTTFRGIGPAYALAAFRFGVRVVDLVLGDPVLLFEQFLAAIEPMLRGFGSDVVFTPHGLAKEYAASRELLARHMEDTTLVLADALTCDRNILFEGAQGAMLDRQFGTYPYVTSSSTGGSAIYSALGISTPTPPSVLGIVKAYTTRVGGGPFVTELLDQIGEHMGKVGAEFGATTGRPRRCGWIDFHQLRHAVRISGITDIALTKLDVLTGIETLQVCNGWMIDGEPLEGLPMRAEDWGSVTPLYEELPGWDEDITGCRSMSELPGNAQRYILRIEAELRRPVTIVSVGPKRSQTFGRHGFKI